MNNELDEILIDATGWDSNNGVSNERLLASLVKWVYDKGFSKSSKILTKKEAAKVNIELTGFHPSMLNCPPRNLAVLQWFTNAPNVHLQTSSGSLSGITNFIIFPPNITYIKHYCYNGWGVKDGGRTIVVFTGSTPPSDTPYSINGGPIAYYFPDEYYDLYASSMHKGNGYGSTTTFNRISDLEEEYKSQIKVIDV